MTPDAAPPPLSPGAQPHLLDEVLIPPLKRLLRAALMAWLVLGPLFWLLAGLAGHGFASPQTVLRRLVDLLQPGLSFLILPAVVLPLLLALARRPWAFGLQVGLMLGSMAQLGLAGVWACMGAYAALHGDDPWEALPWVFPPYLEGFAARHPQIEVLTLNGVRDVRLRVKGGILFPVDGNEIADASVALTPCPSTPDADELGGLVMPPGASCIAQLNVVHDGDERVRYQFQAAEGATREALERHFTDWAVARKLEHHYNGNTRGSFEARGGGWQWRVDITRSNSQVTRLVVPRGGSDAPGSSRKSASTDDD